MSKINSIRIVNLNYNNNSMRVDDEIFNLDSEDTMFSLRNGGGKSVLVQMIMAPFVNKRFRNVKERNFESYFTSQVPTYILVEWKLDNGGGYVLTGMMVRKKQDISDEDSKDKLDIINFIYEYKNKNGYDIENIPIIENIEGKKKVKSFANSKKLFEDLKKDKNFEFNYYDMTSSTTTRAYFDKLMIYDINHKEWENIIKKINLKESGLSELFSNAKNVEGLVKEWFIPAIEDKITRDENRIKNYRDILNSYIKQYKENKSKIDKKEKIELFNKLSKEIKETTMEAIKIIENREALENEIANTIVYLESQLQKSIREEEGLEEEFNNLKEELKSLEYEEKSLEVYKKEEEKSNFNEKYEHSKKEEEELEKKVENLKRKINIFTCSKLHSEYIERSEKLLKLENELKILKEKNQDKAPRRDNIGFNIGRIINDEIEDIKQKEDKRSEELRSLQEEKSTAEVNLKNNNKSINELKGKEGRLIAYLESFNKIEEKFNRKYKENLQRNIEGLLDEEKVLNLEKDISDKGLSLDKEEKQFGEKLIKSKEEEKILESEKEKNKSNQTKIAMHLDEKNKELNLAEEELKERREIIKYIDFKEEELFNLEKIAFAFNSKINGFADEERKIRNSIENIENEIFKLETGKVLELSSELENEFKKRDINIVYGMEWLKKNGYSEEENLEIIKNNPFIPYSLIMDWREIEILKKEPIDIFTSTPIVIIKRESIKNDMKDYRESIISLEGIEFLVSFNNKLLNEEELKKLILENKRILEEKNEELNRIKEDIKLYRDKESIIKTSKLTKEAYENIKIQLQDLNNEAEELRENEIKISKELTKIKEEIYNLKDTIEKIKESLKLNREKSIDFNELKEEYSKYKKQRFELSEAKELIKVTSEEINSLSTKIKDIENRLQDGRNILNNYINEREKLEEEKAKYSIYKTGEIILKDKEDLVAEYEALNKEISSTEQELIREIAEADKKFKEAQRNLSLKEKQYLLSEEEYTKVKYDIHEEQELEERLKSEEKYLKEIRKKSEKLKEDIVKLETEITAMMKRIKEEFNTELLKERELIFEKNYEEEREKIKLRIKNTLGLKEKTSKIRRELDKNLDNLKEYNDLKIKEEIKIELDINTLSDTLGMMKRDLRNLAKDEESVINKVSREINYKLYQKNNFIEDETFRQPIQTFNNLLEKPRELLKQLNIVEQSYSDLIKKLLQDISLINKEEEKIIESLLEYIKDINDNLSQIDNNSTINIGAKRIKMLLIYVPEWEENKESYKIKLKDYIEELREHCLLILDKNENIEDTISTKITSYKLYNEIVGTSNVKIKLYKIEEEKQRQISWDEVAKNSGGEGFLSAFVILSSLLTYIRKDFKDIFTKYESGKVLIMDNPFAQTSSSHLLKPLMDIAKKSNTQLICFTGLGGDSIYNRFNNIYVLNTVQSKLKAGTQYLKGDHVKGKEEHEEKNEFMVSSRLKIEEQMRLF